MGAGMPLIVPRPSARRLEGRTQQMYAAYSEGLSLEEVGRRFGVTRERVRQIFGEAGLPTRSNAETHALRRQRLIHEKGDAIRKAFLASGDIESVAQELGVPHAATKAIVRELVPEADLFRRRGPSRRRYETDELLRYLREAHEACEGRFGEDAYRSYAANRRTVNDHPWPSPYTVRARFGSWARALVAAEIRSTPVRGASRPRISEDECLEALRAAARELGRPPSAAAYKQMARSAKGFPSEMTVRARFGSWRDALVKAGLMPPRPAS